MEHEKSKSYHPENNVIGADYIKALLMRTLNVQLLIINGSDEKLTSGKQTLFMMIMQLWCASQFQTCSQKSALCGKCKCCNLKHSSSIRLTNTVSLLICSFLSRACPPPHTLTQTHRRRHISANCYMNQCWLPATQVLNTLPPAFQPHMSLWAVEPGGHGEGARGGGCGQSEQHLSLSFSLSGKGDVLGQHAPHLHRGCKASAVLLPPLLLLLCILQALASLAGGEHVRRFVNEETMNVYWGIQGPI